MKYREPIHRGKLCLIRTGISALLTDPPMLYSQTHLHHRSISILLTDPSAPCSDSPAPYLQIHQYSCEATRSKQNTLSDGLKKVSKNIIGSQNLPVQRCTTGFFPTLISRKHSSFAPVASFSRSVKMGKYRVAFFSQIGLQRAPFSGQLQDHHFSLTQQRTQNRFRAFE